MQSVCIMFRSPFSSFVMWVLGIKLRQSVCQRVALPAQLSHLPGDPYKDPFAVGMHTRPEDNLRN